MAGPLNTTEDDITEEALERFAQTPDRRLRQIMLALIGHLHAFVKEVNLTEAEWFQAIDILTRLATCPMTSARNSSCSPTRSGCRWSSTY